MPAALGAHGTLDCMTAVPDALAAALSRDPARPLVTHVGPDGARTELSVRTLENGLAKAANLLRDDADLQPGGAGFAQVAREGRVAGEGTGAGVEVDEVRADRLDRAPVDNPVLHADLDALHRIGFAVGLPVAQMPPQPAAAYQCQQEKSGEHAHHGAAAPASCHADPRSPAFSL